MLADKTFELDLSSEGKAHFYQTTNNMEAGTQFTRQKQIHLEFLTSNVASSSIFISIKK